MGIEKGRQIRKVKKITPKESAEILTLRLKGAELEQIAKVVDRPWQTVQRHLGGYKPLFDFVEHIHDYRACKKDLIESAEALSLKSLCITLGQSEGNLQQKAVAFRELFNASRLLNNQSTSNRATLQFTLPTELTELFKTNKPE